MLSRVHLGHRSIWLHHFIAAASLVARRAVWFALNRRYCLSIRKKGIIIHTLAGAQRSILAWLSLLCCLIEAWCLFGHLRMGR
mmetsp:Transcript_89739/g.290408  ORF Transcript_89739/g.290408 Transcript_89739/m.290408 type:complete len:83 (+) Transcript_89739:893-1141(+)